MSTKTSLSSIGEVFYPYPGHLWFLLHMRTRIAQFGYKTSRVNRPNPVTELRLSTRYIKLQMIARKMSRLPVMFCFLVVLTVHGTTGSPVDVTDWKDIFEADNDDNTSTNDVITGRSIVSMLTNLQKRHAQYCRNCCPICPGRVCFNCFG